MNTTRQLFGTDGVRGLANREPMTPETALRLGRAVAQRCAAPAGRRARIVIGKDTRLSGAMLEHALAAGICSAGVDVLLAGVLPTPAVASTRPPPSGRRGPAANRRHNGSSLAAQWFQLPEAAGDGTSTACRSRATQGADRPVTDATSCRCRRPHRSLTATGASAAGLFLHLPADRRVTGPAFRRRPRARSRGSGTKPDGTIGRGGRAPGALGVVVLTSRHGRGISQSSMATTIVYPPVATNVAESWTVRPWRWWRMTGWARRVRRWTVEVTPPERPGWKLALCVPAGWYAPCR